MASLLLFRLMIAAMVSFGNGMLPLGLALGMQVAFAI